MRKLVGYVRGTLQDTQKDNTEKSEHSTGAAHAQTYFIFVLLAK